MDKSPKLTDDPYAHLHNEDYEKPFLEPLLMADGMITMAGRKVQSLDGEWNFVIDPHGEGLRQRWFEYDSEPISNWKIPRDYDGGDWQQINVPGCWNLARPEWFYYEGSSWYSRIFEVSPTETGERVFLRIGAASGLCRIFLNGHFLGLHRGSSTPFFTELTDTLLSGQNRLMIQVDNTRRRDAVPMHHTDWFNYGGLHREVSLLQVPDCFIKDFRASLAPEGRAIDLSVSLSQEVDRLCQVVIEGLGATSVEIRQGEGRQRLVCQPELWRPENPRLYKVLVECGKDRVEDRIGFRNISVEGTNILLNGEPIKLRGICAHEDDLNLGRSTSENDIRRRFAHMRELGCNAARLAHYPHHELAARIADEEGLLLWKEIPVYWAIDFANPATLADAQNQLREMIARDYNRASILFWGVGNENDDTDQRLAFMRRLAETAKNEDPQRLTAAACLINRVHFRIEDRLSEYLDVIGINEYFGWYEPGLENLERLLENSDPGRPVIITETGADALLGLRGSKEQLFSEDHQADILQEQVRMVTRYPYIAGIFPWILYDFRTERRQTVWQRGWNRKGVIAEDKISRKLGFGALQKAYREHF